MTRADAVYVKCRDNQQISVKVMRTRFDPFVDYPEKVVRFRRYGGRICHASGKVGHGDWYWRFVSKSKQTAHQLSN
jgi:hypothetical protein